MLQCIIINPTTNRELVATLRIMYNNDPESPRGEEGGGIETLGG